MTNQIHETASPNKPATTRPGGLSLAIGAKGKEKPTQFFAPLTRLFSQLRPEASWLWLVLGLGIIGVCLGVAGPKILGLATDKLLAGVVGTILGQRFPAGTTKEQAVAALKTTNPDLAKLVNHLQFTIGQGIDFSAIAIILLICLVLFATSSLFLFTQGWVLNGVVQRTIFRLRQQTSAKLARLPLSYFDKRPRGEILSRFTNDIDNINTAMQQSVTKLFNSTLSVIGILIMMLWISPVLALIAFTAIPLIMFSLTLISKRSHRLFAAQWKATGELNAQIEEAYSGHALVKVFGRKREVEATFATHNNELFSASAGAQFISALILPLMIFVGNLSYVAIALLGGLRVATGQMTLGDLQAFINYTRRFNQPLSDLASVVTTVQSGLASAERVFQLLDAEEHSADETGELPITLGPIRFENVNFSYTKDKPLITDLNLVAEPGQTIAIVGPTGAGKTTLVNLLMRFYELDSGKITFGGTDIATVPRDQLRRRIGMVLQDTWLFGGTIGENIAYGHPGANELDIIQAAKSSYVDRFVHALPNGYDTILNSEGDTISSGEKQLITIARAFLSDPDILILDEATSSVDTRTEVLIQNAMKALRNNRTCFVIAHRLSTIRDADLILVLEHGQIVEQGTHKQLLETNGHYYQLYQSQFAGPTTVEAA